MHSNQTRSRHIGLGTAAIGRPKYINIRQEKTGDFDLKAFRQKGMEVLEYAWQSGIRYFDTAPGYGMAENLLIDWLKTKNDPVIEIATKWGYTYTANFDPHAKVHEVKEHSLEKLNEQWQRSKLLSPYLTTYQIHSATFETGVLDNREILERLAELKTKYSLHMGLSASGPQQAEIIRKAKDITIDGKTLFTAFQVTYNLLEQSVAEIAALLIAEGKRVIIKEALANGRVFPNADFPNHQQLYSVLGSMAQKYKVGIDAIALRFCIESLQPFKVLSGAANAGHVSQNLEATKLMLESDDLALLKSFNMAVNDYWAERKNLTWN